MSRTSMSKILNWLVVISMLASALFVASPVKAASGLVTLDPITPGIVKSGATIDVTFLFNGIGAGGAGKYNIYLAGTQFGPYTANFDGIAKTTKTITVPSLADNTYQVSVQAILDTQTVPWVVSNIVTVVVDNTNPDVKADALTSPNGGENWDSTTAHDITWDATKITDAHLSATPISLFYSLNGGISWTLIATGEANDGIYPSWIPGVVSTHTLIKIEAKDDAGNKGSDQSNAVFTVYGVDTTPPDVTIMAPLSGASLENPTFISKAFDFVADAFDGQSGIISVVFQYSANNGASWTDLPAAYDTGDQWKANLDTTTLPDGTYLQVKAHAVNGVGAFADSPVQQFIKIDNSAPTGAMLAPAANGTWIKSNYTLKAAAVDPNSGIASVTFQVQYDDAGTLKWMDLLPAVTTADDAGNYNFPWLPNETMKAVRALIKNNAGLSFTTPIVTVQVDTTLPVVNTALTLDASVLQIGSTHTFTWDKTKITDAHLAATPITLDLYVGPDWHRTIGANLGNTGTFNWVVAGLPGNGNVMVCLTAADLAGNTTSVCLPGLTIWGTDTTAPNIALDAIDPLVSGTVTLSAVATDPESDVNFVTFSFQQWDEMGLVWGAPTSFAPVYNLTDGKFVMDWDTTGLNGKFKVTATATNGVGLTKSVSQEITIDNSAPVLDGWTPWGGQQLHKVAVFYANVYDPESGIKAVRWEWAEIAPDLVWNLAGVGTYDKNREEFVSSGWDTTTLPDGPYLVRLVFSNNAGNELKAGPVVVFIMNTTAVDMGEGWNLISLPFIPEDGAVETIMAKQLADSSLVKIVSWVHEDGNLVEKDYIPGVGGDIATIDDGLGYWVNVTSGNPIEFIGDEMPAPPQAPHSYKVYAGWNLIGYKTMLDDWHSHGDGHMYGREVTEYLGPAVMASLQAPLYGYDAETGMYFQLYEWDCMRIGNGYWMAVDKDGTIYP